MKNKEVIDRLQKYFLDQDPKIIARALANMMIDFNRISNIDKLPIDELDLLRSRIQKNVDELHKFIENGASENMKLHDLSILRS